MLPQPIALLQFELELKTRVYLQCDIMPVQIQNLFLVSE